MSPSDSSTEIPPQLSPSEVSQQYLKEIVKLDFGSPPPQNLLALLNAVDLTLKTLTLT